MKRQLAYLLLFLSINIFAAEVPELLQPWEDWARHQQEFRECPFFSNQPSANKQQHICAWPGVLKLDIKDNSGSYSINWQVIEDSWIPLPGKFNASTLSVTDNGKAATIRYQSSATSVFLTKGSHQIQGSFNWQSRPEELFIPAEIALVDLVVDGVEIKFPESSRGFIWLGEPRGNEKVQVNHTEIQVERLLTDGSPMQMRIKVYLDVSGAARDEMLGRVLTDGMEIINISGALASRIDAKGNLWAQLRPGDWKLDIILRIKDFPEKFTFKPEGKNWPKQEIWSWRSRDQLRITQISGVEPIDADQAMSDQWQSLPHYLITEDSSFTISEKSRGMSEDKDRLELQRSQWLNFDGDGYIFQDRITGFKTSNWRLDMVTGYELKSARSHDEDLLITQIEAGGSGVEIRRPSVNLLTSGEVTTDNANKVSGWSASFDRVTTKLFIPPGRMLLAAPLADESYGDWLGLWSLWSLFSVLILLAVISRFISWKVAIPALVALVLGYFETGMPLVLWFNLVIAMVIAQRVLTGLAGKIASGYQLFSVVILVIALFPFIVDQIRSTLYPQLEIQASLGGRSAARLDDLLMEVKKTRIEESKMAMHREQKFREVRTEEEAGMLMDRAAALKSPEVDEERIVLTASRISRADVIDRYQPGALIQAGSALPDWQWQTARLSWTGPIDAAEESSLIVLGRFGRALWRISLILASIIWLVLLLPGIKKPEIDLSLNKTATSMLLVFGLFFLPQFSNTAVAGEFPDKQLLTELQQRLYPDEKCEPACASLVKATVVAKQKQLILNLEYHTSADVAVNIPTSKDWKINRLSSNGKTLPGIFKNRNGNWIQLSKGIHHLSIRGELSPSATISVAFKQQPGHISAAGEGWEFAGIAADKLSGNTLQLIRFIKPDEALTSGQTSEQTTTVAKSFVRVERELSLSNEWELFTSVSRIAPTQGALNVSIPLWEFEHPFIATKKLSEGKMEVSLEPGDNEFSWRSNIKSVTQLVLKSEQNPDYVESWRITASPMWNLQVDGVPLIYPVGQDVNDYWSYLFIPRAGEELTLTVSRPEAVSGDTLVIENISMNYNPGRRGSESELSLQYRATQAQQLPLTFSETANVSEVKIDGQAVNIRPENSVLILQAKTGSHNVTVRWRDENKIAFVTESPQFAMAGDYSNLNMGLTVPANRWTLSVSGPGYGPVILYWGELLVFVLLAIGLSRIAISPLSFWQWLLLGLGMSTYSWPALAFVIIWLVGLGWRKGIHSDNSKTRVVLQWTLLLSSIIAVLALVTAIPYGLLSSPDMSISGNGSYGGYFSWFLDRGSESLPQVSFISLPMWVYKALMLLWATWISFSLIKWISWAWNELKQGIWQLPKKTKTKKIAKD